MTLETVLFLAAGALAGGFVNGLAGFGTALFALGWWLQVMPPLQAVAIVLPLSVATGIPGAIVVRKSISLRALVPFLLPALIGIPIGIQLLQFVDARQLRLVVATFLLIYGGFFIARRDLPKISAPTPVIDSLIGFGGGILGGIAGLSGALPTMWLAMRDWSKGQTRAILQPFNLTVLAISATMLAAAGTYDRTILSFVAVALPFSMVGWTLGIWLFKRLSDGQFRRLLIVLMFLSGVSLFVRELI